MKKLLVSLLTVLVAATCVFTMAGCSDNVKLGSKVQKIKMTLEVYDASGAVTETTDVYMELYLNFAPESTAHVIKLVNEGYYNGTCVSNVTSTWMEFGAYAYDTEGNFKQMDYNGEAVKGEFINNGLQGNKLSTTRGAIVFKRDYDDNTTEDAVSKYDTAKATMAICFSSSASSTFDSKSYCILGLVLSDDANEDADTDLEKKSSIEKLATLTEYQTVKDDNDNTVTTYYYEKTGEFYTKWTDSESAEHYCEGAEIDADAELTGKALEDYKKLFNDNKNYFLVVPSVKLVIKSMSVC